MTTERQRAALVAVPPKPACSAPELGRRLSLALGQPVAGKLAEHLLACPACQLERRRFDAALRSPVAPRAGFAARLERAMGDRRSSRQGFRWISLRSR